MIIDRRKRRAQLRMAESMAILIIFIILVFFGFVVYAKFKTANLKSQARELSSLDVIDLAKFVSNMPEIHCSRTGVDQSFCIDIYKLRAFEDNIWETRISGDPADTGDPNTFLDDFELTEKGASYLEKFGESLVVIYPVFPDVTIGSGSILPDGQLGQSIAGLDGNTDLYRLWYLPPKSGTRYSTSAVQIPVILHDPVTNKNIFSVLAVVKYT